MDPEHSIQMTESEIIFLTLSVMGNEYGIWNKERPEAGLCASGYVSNIRQLNLLKYYKWFLFLELSMY
jgi:hypothetical protein